MSRTKKQPLNPYIKDLLESKGYHSVKEAATDLNLNYPTLNRLSTSSGGHAILEFHRQAARKFDVPLDQWVDMLIGGENHV